MPSVRDGRKAIETDRMASVRVPDKESKGIPSQVHLIKPCVQSVDAIT